MGSKREFGAEKVEIDGEFLSSLRQRKKVKEEDGDRLFQNNFFFVRKKSSVKSPLFLLKISLFFHFVHKSS